MPLTIEQQQALAIAQAKRKRAEAGPASAAPAQSNGAGMGPVNPMVAEGLRAQQEANLAPRSNIKLPAARGPVMAPNDPLRAEAQRATQDRIARREASRAYGGGMDMLVTTDEQGQLRPGTDVDRDIGAGITGTVTGIRPINALSNTAEAAANLPGDVLQTAMGGQRVIPRADIPSIPMPKELESFTGDLSQGIMQFLMARGVIGKAAPGGGLAANASKDAAAIFAGFDSDAPRMTETLAADFMRQNGMGWMAERDPNNPLIERVKNGIEEMFLAYAPVEVARRVPQAVDAITGAARLPVTPANAGGARPGSVTPQANMLNPAARPPAAPAAQPQPQPSVAPVVPPNVAQGAAGAAQPGPAGAGQQAAAGGAQPVLNAVPVAPAATRQQTLVARDTAKILTRIMRAANLKNADIRGYLPGAVQRYKGLNDSRVPFAFFLESDLPKHFADPVAADIVTKLQGWGRARNAAMGKGDTSAQITQGTIKELRGSQQDFLTQSAEANLYKGSLISQEDQILKSLRETGKKGYEPVLAYARDAMEGRRVPNAAERAGFEELRGVLARPVFRDRIPNDVRMTAEAEGLDILELIERDPVTAAHWLQSNLNKLEDAAEINGRATPASLAYGKMRADVLDPLKKAAPGYEGALNRYGHEWGSKNAVRFGKGLFTEARSAYDTGQKVRAFKRLGRRQQTVAWKSIRDEFLNEFRGTAEDAAAKITRMQQEGALDLLEQLGARGKRFADDIRRIAQQENPSIRAIEQASNSLTFKNLTGAEAAREMVQSPVNQVVGSVTDKASWPMTIAADAVVMGTTGLPVPLMTAAKAMDRFGNPGPRTLSRATEGLYGLPPKATTGNALAVPPRAPRGAGKPKPAAAPVQQDLGDLLKALDEVEKDPKRRGGPEGKRLMDQIEAVRAGQVAGPAKPRRVKGSPQSAPTTPAKPKPPTPGQTSRSPAAIGSGLATGGIVGGATYAATGDEDLALKAGILSGIGGGVLGNRLAKAGKTAPKAPAGRGGAPKPPPAAPAAAMESRPAASVSSVPQSRTVAKVRMPNGADMDVLAEVFTNGDRVIMSPVWPTNMGDDLEAALKQRQAGIRAEERGMRVVNDAPQSPDWATQNPKEWTDVQRQIGERFLGMVKSNPGPAHVLALVDGVDMNTLGSIIEAGMPRGSQLLRSQGNGEFAVVNRSWLRDNPKQFQSWEKEFPAYNQAKGLRPPPAEWSGIQSKPPRPANDAASASASKPPPVKSGFGSSKLPMDEGSRMARAREMGFDVDTPLYHGTTADFDQFEIGDLGFHVGTSEQANKRVRALERDRGTQGANVMPVYVRAKKPLDLPDVGEWNDSRVVAEKLAQTPWGRKHEADLLDIADSAADDVRMFEDADAWRADGNNQELLDEIRRLIEADGYDSVRYHNQVENAYGDKPGLTRSAQKRQEELLIKQQELNRSRPTKPPPKLGATEEDINDWIFAKDPETPPALQKQLDDVRAELDALNAQTENPYSYIIFDPSNIRGKFAKFDPSQEGSSKLLAGVRGNPAAIGATGGGLAGGILNPRDANGDGVINDADRGLNAAAGALSFGVAGGILGSRMGKAASGNALRGKGAVRSQGVGGEQSGGQSKGIGPNGQRYTDEAVEHFGLTDDLREAGYLLPDGRMLDLSGRHDMLGGDYVRKDGRNIATGRDWQAGVRHTDHRELPFEVVEAKANEKNFGNTSTAHMLAFQKESGAIRVMPGTGISVSAMPSDKQIKALVTKWRRTYGDQPMLVDVDDAVSGKNLSSIDVPRVTVEDVKRALAKASNEQPPAAQGFGGRPNPPNALKGKPRPMLSGKVIEELNLAKKTMPQDVRNKLAANAAKPPALRVSAAEAAGDDPSIYATVAPFQRSRKPLLARRAPPNAVERGVNAGMARIDASAGKPPPLDEAGEATRLSERQRRAAKSAAQMKANQLNPYANEAAGIPDKPLPKSVAAREQEATDLAITARQLLAKHRLTATEYEQAVAAANQRKAVIADALVSGRIAPPARPGATPTGVMPGSAGQPLPPRNMPPVSRRAADEMAELMFDRERAQLVDEILSGDVIPRNRDKYHAALLLTAGGATGAIGATAVVADIQGSADQRRKQNADTSADQPAYDNPGDPRFVWDWGQIKSKRNDAMRAIQIQLNALPPNASGGKFNLKADGLWSENGQSDKAIKSWLYQNGFDPNGPFTMEHMDMLDQQALEARQTTRAAPARKPMPDKTPTPRSPARAQ